MSDPIHYVNPDGTRYSGPIDDSVHVARTYQTDDGRTLQNVVLPARDETSTPPVLSQPPH